MYRILFVAVLLFVYDHSTAQVPANLIGSNALDLKWSQINTDKVRIIFPSQNDSTAQRMANIIHRLWAEEDTSIGSTNIKASILLHSQAAISNGFVTVGPFRSEFFPSQRQFGNATDYIDLLTIHEYRHIQQFANATKGITKLAKNVLGSWAWGGFMATALPRWYFEGDAVISETEHTATGRGRLPSFNMQYHALFRDNVRHNYEKAGAGSIKDYVPDWYPLGYNIMSYGKREYGQDLWANVADDAVRYKGIFYPFSRSLKKRTGLSSAQMYDAAFEDLRKSYKAHIGSLTLNDFDYVGQNDTKHVTDFTMPLVHGEDTLMIKSAYDALASVVKISRNQSEEKLCEIGRQLDGQFATISVGGRNLAWAELANDIRWRYRQYSDIYVYDLSSNTPKRLTQKERYQSPALSKDGYRIAAVIVRDDLSQDIHVLSAGDGQVLHEIVNNSYGQISHPAWLDKDRLVVVATRDEVSQLVSVDIASGTWASITEPSNDQLSNPYPLDNEVYYSASYSGINNIYKINLDTKAVHKLTETPVGAYQPSVTQDGQWLLYSELESEGMKAKKMSLSEVKAAEYKVASVSSENRYAAHTHEASTFLPDLPDTTFGVSKFNKWTGIFKPHSLLPQFNHPTASISLVSDNVFGTMSAQAGAFYDYNEEELSYVVGLTYAELFPIINVSYVHGRRSAQFFNFSPLSDTSAVFSVFGQRWVEDRFTGGLTIPLNLSARNVVSRVSLSANYQVAKLSVESNFDNENNFRDTIRAPQLVRSLYDQPIRDATISTLDFRLRTFAFKRQARLHVQPRWGGTFSMRYRKQLGSQLSGGDVLNVDASLFIPGLLSTHSLYITTAYQSESVLDNYRYSDVFNYSRGYDLSIRRDKYFKVGFNYAFPLWYPDLAVGPFAFIKRVKANAFFDYGRLGFSTEPFNGNNNMHSAGVELGFDFRAFRLVEVDMGVRYSYLMNPELSSNGQRHQFDFFVISITQ